ncbi:MAG: PqqD family protein [Chloroflexi bacterium]|nr:PqqD family protein [Chloroflexota bacterium]
MSETQIKRNDDFIFRKIVNEMILVPVKHDVADMEHIFTLNEVGAFVWEKLSKSSTIEELQQDILDEFEVDPAMAQQDLQVFLEDLEAFQALEWSQ